MTHHHHHTGEAHPVARIAPSLLRMAARERLALAAITVIVLWAAVWWALSQP
jgi:type II secretory pathway component PulM